MLIRFKDLLRIPFHPFLWGIYPLSSLYLVNIAEIPVAALAISLVFSLAMPVLVFVLAYLALCLFKLLSSQRSYPRTIFVLMVMVVFYFLLYRLLKNFTIHETYIFRHRYLIPLWILVFVLALMNGLKPINLKTVWKDPHMLDFSATASSFWLILFFSYGHVFNLIQPAGAESGTSAHLIPGLVWIAIFLAGLFFLVNYESIGRLTLPLNSFVSLLMIITLTQITLWKIQFLSRPAPEPSAVSPTSRAVSDSPDIYYIILDGYGRSDYLLEEFGFDNSAFLTELEMLGFVVPECTQSNYHLTILSMTSTLNMTYLSDLPPGMDGNSSYLDFAPYLQQSRVLQFFEDLGYETFTFSGINPYTEISNSTHFYGVPEGEISVARIDALNFYHLFLQTTALRPVLEYVEQNPKSGSPAAAMLGNFLPFDHDLTNRHYLRYQQNVYHLTVLQGIPDLPGKKFVYAHLYMAHEPFVFTPEGDFQQEDTESGDAYIDQIRFLNERIPSVIRTILEKSSIPPIIVLHADHDWGWDNNRVRILNAYHLPDGGNQEIYPSITPVNTFRAIINKYFHGDFELLPDASYYGPYGDFQFGNLSSAPPSCVHP